MTQEEFLKKLSKKRSSTRKRLFGLMFFNLMCVISLVLLVIYYGPLAVSEVKYAYASIFDEEVRNSKRYFEGLPKAIASGDEISLRPIVTIPKPKDPQFSVIIPKLGINQKVISDVNINNESEVQESLTKGIGWAKGTVEPGSDGNSLLFAHSTVNTWNIGRYNAEFTLLRNLERNDFFTVVYKNRQYDFIVYDKQIVDPNDKSYITSVGKGKLVTLQTCHPPGINTQRLIVRGRLVAMEVR